MGLCKNFLIFAFFVILLSLPVIADVFLTETSDKGSNVFFIGMASEIEYKKGSDVQINAYVFNNSGYRQTNESTDCFINIFDKVDGSVLVNEEMYFSDPYFNHTVMTSIADKIGSHKFIVYCNSTILGAFRTGSFEITESGSPDKNYEIWVIVIAMLIAVMLLIIGFQTQDFNLLMLSGFIFMGLGVFIFVNGFLGLTNFVQDIISTILIFFGGYITLRPVMEYLQINLR